MKEAPNTKITSYFFLAFAPLCWAGNMVVARAVRDEIPPLSLNWWRWTLAAVVLLAFTLPGLARQRTLLIKHWQFILVLSATGIVGFNSAIYVGLTLTTAVNAALIVGLGPALIIPLAWILLGEGITRVQGLGVAVSTLGALVIILRGDVGVLPTLNFNSGDLWLLFASVLWATYSVLLKCKPVELEVVVLLTAVIVLGAVLSTPLYLLEISRGLFIPLSIKSIVAIAYVSMFASVLAYIAWSWGVNQVGPNKASLFLHLLPVYGAGLAALVLDEQFKVYHLVGFALILAGLVLTARFGSKSAPGLAHH